MSLGTDIYTTLIIVKILMSADQDTISAVMADVKILKAVLLANVQMDMSSATMVSNSYDMIFSICLFCMQRPSLTSVSFLLICDRKSLNYNGFDDCRALNRKKKLVKLGRCISCIHNFSGFLLMHSLS